MKNIQFISVVVAMIIATQSMATEVSSIRFSKSEQLARLVIDSDNALAIEEEWQNEKLVLVLKGLSKPITADKISEQAILYGIKIIVSDDLKETRILIPILKKKLKRRFELVATNQMPYRTITDWSVAASESVIKTSNPTSNLAKTKSVAEPSEQSLKQRSEDALTNNNYRLAISLLTTLLDKGAAEDKPFALEFLGVARERNYQLAFAKQYYQRFLAEFADLEQAPRVQQRLNALIGIQNIAQTKTLKAGKKKVRRQSSYTRGSLSSDYRKARLVDDIGNSRDTISLVSLDFDLRGRYQYKESALKVRFSAGHYEDILDDGSATTDRLRYANVGWESRDKSYSVDFGRQRSRGKGIFGRFDGLVLGYGVNEQQKVSVTVGYPVASSKILSVDSERSFVGVSYDWQSLFENVDVSIFAISQSIGDLTDRQAIGGEFKYINGRTSVYGLLDYDTFFAELNALLISGSYTTQDRMRYHWSINKRKSPYISTRNALVGQSSDSLEELQNFFLTEDEILDLAVDRTLESSTATFMVSKPINDTFDVTTSVTWMDISGAPESGGVAEIIDSDAQVYFNVYLGARKLYSENDSNQIGLRVSNLSTSDVWSVFAHSQYKISKGWKVRGKVRYDDRTSDNGSEQQSVSPGLRLQYQDRNNYFYTELGAIFYTNQTSPFPEVTTDIYYLYLGYRLYF